MNRASAPANLSFAEIAFFRAFSAISPSRERQTGRQTRVHFRTGASSQAELKRLSTTKAGPHRIPASHISGVPLPSPLPSLHLRRMAERTHDSRSLRSRAIHRLRIRGLRVLRLRRGRWRGRSLQRLPASPAKGGRGIHRCPTVRTEGNRRLIHEILLIASRLTKFKTPLERLALAPSRAKLYRFAASFPPIQILSIVRTQDVHLRTLPGKDLLPSAPPQCLIRCIRPSPSEVVYADR